MKLKEFNCKPLYRQIISSLELEDDSNISFPIGEATVVDGVVYYPLITLKFTK